MQRSTGHPEFSVIISCYYEENTIEEFYLRLSSTLQKTARSYEIILVNDGSKDATFSKLRQLYEANSDIACIIDLFKNSGQAAGLTAGIEVGVGQHFIFIDSDLQLDPEELPMLLAKFDQGYDVVTGIRPARKDSLKRKLFSFITNKLLNYSSGLQLSDYGCTFKVLRGELIRIFDLGPFKVWSPILSMSKAGVIAEVPITHHPRREGESGWRFLSLLDFFMESLLNASSRVFQILAIILFSGAGVFFLRLIGAFFTDFEFIDQITNGLLLYIFLIISFLTASLMLLLGEYLLRLYRKSQGIPFYVTKERIFRTTAPPVH